jgi:hypothetical protein
MIQFTGFIAVNVIFRGVLLDRRRQDERAGRFVSMLIARQNPN